MTESLPRPSILLAVVSVIVIAGNLLLLSIFLVENIIEPSNPFAMMGGLLFVPLCFAMAVQQYRGTFRRVPSAAATTSVLLYIVGGFMTFGTVTTAGEGIVECISLRLMAPLLGTLFLVAACSIAAGRMNALWSRNLRSAINSLEVSPVRRGFSMRELLLGISVIAAMTWIAFYFVRSAPLRHAEHIESTNAPFSLPANTKDVSYCKGFRGTIAFEFTVDEPAFREWVDSGIGSIESQSASVPLKEIVFPIEIIRYNFYSLELDGPDKISVSKGLYYYWSRKDRGVCAAFDRTTSRAYYHAHWH